MRKHFLPMRDIMERGLGVGGLRNLACRAEPKETPRGRARKGRPTCYHLLQGELGDLEVQPEIFSPLLVPKMLVPASERGTRSLVG